MKRRWIFNVFRWNSIQSASTHNATMLAYLHQGWTILPRCKIVFILMLESNASAHSFWLCERLPHWVSADYTASPPCTEFWTNHWWSLIPLLDLIIWPNEFLFSIIKMNKDWHNIMADLQHSALYDHDTQSDKMILDLNHLQHLFSATRYWTLDFE